MATKWLFLVPVLTLSPLVLAGAWRVPFPPPPPADGAPFVPQAVPVNHALIGDEATGADLLDRAADRLAPARVAWLRTRIWQRMADPTADFEAAGTLDLGPGQCARLELTVRTRALAGRVLRVSDGRALAQVSAVGHDPAQVSCHLLPTGPDGSPDRLRFLAEKGCGGPGPLLRDLRRVLRGVRLQTGLLRGTAVIRLRGDLDEGQVPGSPAGAEYAYLYLDAQTLWPHRLEWWGDDRGRRPRAILEMEFRDPELNRELPLTECARLFSYQPEAGE